MFVTGHVALNNMLEQSIQAVDPSVSLPYWEYAREADTCKVCPSVRPSVRPSLSPSVS